MGTDAPYALGQREFGMNPLRPSALIRTALLVAAMFGAANSIAPTAYAQKAVAEKAAIEKAAAKKFALQKFAEGIAELVKAAAGGNAQKKEAEAVQFFGVQAPPKRESELKERKVRLEAYSKAATDWINSVVSLQPNQRQLLKKTLDGKIAASQLAGQKPKPNNIRIHQGFNDSFAINFTDTNGAAIDLNFLQQERLLAEISLTPDQQAALDEAKQERKAFHEAATVGHVLNLLDDHLYLTAAQRAIVADVVKDKVDLNAACYAVTPTNYYFQQTSIVPVFVKAQNLDALGETQKRRAGDLSATNRTANSEEYIIFRSDAGVDSWPQQLRDAMKAQRARMMRAIAVRVDFHNTSDELTDSDVRHLQVAGKGATETAIATWKTASLARLKGHEERAMQFGNGNFSFSIAVPDVQQFENHPIWEHAVERLLPTASDQLAARHEVRAEAMANFIVAMLDRELWLTKKQRDILIKAVREEVPLPDTRIVNANYFLEVSLLTIPMFRLSIQDLVVLTDSQKTALAALKKPFQKQGTRVIVQMQNGSQMHLQIPN